LDALEWPLDHAFVLLVVALAVVLVVVLVRMSAGR
jgi:hypothetical protein